MDALKIHKALANETRLAILKWLKEPEKNFPEHQFHKGFQEGVCAAFIQEKSGLGQSTISHFLSTLHHAELIIPTRIGKWTYYKRNEETISQFINEIKMDY